MLGIHLCQAGFMSSLSLLFLLLLLFLKQKLIIFKIISLKLQLQQILLPFIPLQNSIFFNSIEGQQLIVIHCLVSTDLDFLIFGVSTSSPFKLIFQITHFSIPSCLIIPKIKCYAMELDFKFNWFCMTRNEKRRKIVSLI